ncbi:hypothetical protein EJB05_33894 [Eragrostis curvula]|uniref:glutathione transferase n=1 Tax=Eragrostis curvula TaxID=38414 RepID=A0A5J9U2L1_9POAL|nr:hypothetical protein EJB05_33894 [Eragrostis curvula]
MEGAAVKVYGVASSPFVATVLLCLEEVGAAYEVVPLDMASREQKAPHHLARNPLGKIPALEDGDLMLFGGKKELLPLPRIPSGNIALPPARRTSCGRVTSCSRRL